MYSRNYGGIQSEGQLYNLQNELKNELNNERREEPRMEALPTFKEGGRSSSIFDKFRGIFDHFEIDDLILIAIGVLLLLDGDTDNDILLIVILALLFL
ncbi:MAG: hypothetical protein GX148_04405 [Clostridiales bacterium]|jgi:hypothetical protein|nr:hypothetical protein [Clostridiales bacterium]